MYICLDGDEALEYGVDEAIMLSHLRFWINTNKNNNHNFNDGHYWCWCSVSGFSETFYFWTQRQIRRVLKSLVDKKVIIEGNYNKKRYDKTKWYAFVNEEKMLDSKDKNPVTFSSDPVTESSNACDQNVTPIPDNNTDKNNNTYSRRKKTTRFTKPTLEEVKEYCIQRNSCVDAKRFCDYYEAGNWIDVNGNQVKNWKQKLITWENRQAKNTNVQKQETEVPSQYIEEPLTPQNFKQKREEEGKAWLEKLRERERIIEENKRIAEANARA